MKTLKISEKAHKELTKVKGEFMALEGKEITYEETILRLCEERKKQKE